MIVELSRPYRGFSTAFDAAVRTLDTSDQGAFIALDIRGLTLREAEAILGRHRSDLDRSATRARFNLKKELT